MNKFEKNLTASNKEIKGKRASIVANSAKKAQQCLIDSLENEVDDLELELLNLEDLHPTHMHSLMPTAGKFDGAQWTKQVQETKLALSIKREELEIATATYNEYFADIKKVSKTEEKSN